ncbi:FKBP-type peptidyl-prolyl cis-trans isomerase [Aurantibacter crassamenti]|uniref:FKBP-type peptidyl-prolyl cis-trans isomerase n=1 Tax=Aurantibacter crassamenti TaxID=1837375 RepID=UPI00193A8C09|nr:FKBP-type peptidyl-prolyl cis-trans isomerase [Aurantibacter crassamenti]MBM1106614.1 FKBP-type peptidyl-prolyl cis-trans isomerase [Aurantibacter crassamenti]
MQLKRIFYLLVLVIFIGSCNNDDDETAVVVPPQTLTETIASDEAAIKEYLSTHFYNYEDFANPADDFDYKIVIGDIEGDNAGKTPLLDQVETQTIKVEITEEEGLIDHTLYYLIAREGVGENPTIGDNSFVHYEGSLLDGTIFDISTTPAVFNLSGVVRGFGNGVTKLKSGTGPIENGNGTVSYEDYGVGMIIMPSALGYYNSSSSSLIPSYSPLIFKVDLLSYLKNTDTDEDGIPNIEEDVDGDGNLNNDNTDVDTEFSTFLANYTDSDDDGDGISTLDEISDENGVIIKPYPDTDNDGTPDYLDSDS